MIIIRFITGLSSGFVVIASLLAIPGIALLFWSADQNANPPSVPYSYQCEYGVYDPVKHYWYPLVDGKFPHFNEPYANQYLVSYAVKVTITNDSTSQSLDLDGYSELLVTGGLWSSYGSISVPNPIVPPGGSAVAYVGMSWGADFGNLGVPPPTSCELDATFYPPTQN